MGGILFGFLGHLTIKWGRYPVVLLGSVLGIDIVVQSEPKLLYTCYMLQCEQIILIYLNLGLLSYGLMFANFPMSANSGETSDIGFISPPSEAMALATSFILGFSDACFNTQVTMTSHICSRHLNNFSGCCNSGRILER